MDKNKSRSDLLAAGRKKLQQFRQKKDGKGSSSHGKLSKKSNKTEQHDPDSDVSQITAKSSLSSQVPEGDTGSNADSNSRIVDLSTSHDLENLVAPEVEVAAVDLSSVPIIPEAGQVEMELVRNAELPLDEQASGQRNDDSSVLLDGENSHKSDSGTAALDIPVEDETKNSDMFVMVESAEDMADGMPITVEAESLNNKEWQEQLPIHEDVCNMPLSEARGDQAADGLGSEHFDPRAELELERDGKLPSSEPSRSAETSEDPTSGGTVEELATYETGQVTGTDDVLASSKANKSSDGLLASALASPEVDENLVACAIVTGEQKDEVAVSSNEKESEVLSGSHDCRNSSDEWVQADTDAIEEGYDHIYFPDASNTVVGKDHEKQLETSKASSSADLTVFSFGDGCSITLPHVSELIRGLGEDEHRFLFNSREMVSNTELGTGTLISSLGGVFDLVERLKEELYLTAFIKDIFSLLVKEQSDLQMEFDDQNHLLVDEISSLRSSCNNAFERSESLAEELVHCRSELQAVTSEREELQSQLHRAKAEAEEFSARVRELQISLERSKGDLSSLSHELTESRNLVASLKVENENLNGTITSLTEERKELVVDKESSLHENKMLSVQLAECKSLAAGLQVETSTLSGTLALVTEERDKLKEDKESLACDSDKLSMELADCKGLVVALQNEIGDLNRSFALLVEERNKLEDKREFFNRENQKVASELLVLQERVSNEHGERMQIELELREVNTRLEQLNEENTILNSSLVLHQAKLRENDSREAQISSLDGKVKSLENWSRANEKATDDEFSHHILGEKALEGSSLVLETSSHDDLAKGVVEHHEVDLYDETSGFVMLKRHVEEAEKILQNLDRAFKEMHSYSVSLSTSSDKGSVPGVSKLIEAFESKVHHEEQGIEEGAITEHQLPAADPFVSVKDQMQNLRAVLGQMNLDAQNVSILFKQEQDCKRTACVTFMELKVQYKALEKHSENLEATAIELDVLYEVVKQQLYGVQGRNKELEFLYEALKIQDTNLQEENSHLGERLGEYEGRISELQNQLYDLQQSSDEMASVTQNQLESLKKEAAERALIVEQDWNCTAAQIVETIGRLDVSVGRLPTSAFSVITHDGSDVSCRVASSVTVAIKVIEDLQEKLEGAYAEHESICSTYKEVNEKFNDLLEKHELAMDVLHKIYCDLSKMVIVSYGPLDETEMNMDSEKLPDPVDYYKCKALIEQVENLLGEKLQLQSVNDKLKSELMSKTKHIEELSKGSLDSYAIQKLVKIIEDVVMPEDVDVDSQKLPGSHFESLVSLLVQKYKDAAEQVNLTREQFGSRVMEMTELEERINQLSTIKLHQENEIHVLKESVCQAEEALNVARSKLQEKISELEQSEQRVSSIREKLSIAVAKGKGLVVQRDSLKQSLAETSSELERCLQELQMKDARLLELETKLKIYSEAGERVESLESELSYIRNSATALRESFLLKDSVLQRIEEILEDLDLPEHFHSRNIIEKVDWLARSASGHSVPLTDWDQKSSVVGSYSDAGFVVTDSWKEDSQSSSNLGDDLRRKYEELQNKFYGLAEQNEMLEQSLMERNNLVQRWEELLNRVDMPSQLQSVEPEDRIEWLGSALSEANLDRNSLWKRIDNLEDSCRSLSADLEESRKRTSELESGFRAVIEERGQLSERLEILTHDHEKLSAKAIQLELENEKMQSELSGLQEQLIQKLGNEERVRAIEGEIMELQNLVSDALQDDDSKDLLTDGCGTECLEELLRKLIENYTILSSRKPELLNAVGVHHSGDADGNLGEVTSRDTQVNDDSNIDVLKKELEEALRDLMHVKEERDIAVEKQQSLVHDVEALDQKREELQELLKQEEQRSSSVREKLNVAVRKGKSLVQQRDSLKHTIEEMNAEMERLKYDVEHRENALKEYEHRLRDFSTYPERIEALESENKSLRNQLTETMGFLQEKENSLSLITSTLDNIDVGDDFDASDPVVKLESVGKLCRDLHAAVASSEQEVRKSKRAAELLLAELNEVQERNDSLQDELAKAAGELAELSKQRDVAEAGKFEALSRLEKLSMVLSEEKEKQYSEFVAIRSGIDQLKQAFFDVNALLNDLFSKDMEFMHNLETNLVSWIKQTDSADMVEMPLSRAAVGITNSNSRSEEHFLSMNSWFGSPAQVNDNVAVEVCSFVGEQLQGFKTEIGTVKERLHKHVALLHDQAGSLPKVLGKVHREMTSQKESFESMKRAITHAESIANDRNNEIVKLQKNISLLYEACAASIMDISNRNVELLGNYSAVEVAGLNLKLAPYGSGALPFGGQTDFSSQEFIKTVADMLLLTIKDFGRIGEKLLEGNQKEMKITIANLQKELQEKDIQKDRICTELVNQIKDAESVATSYSLELQDSKIRVHDLESRVEVMEEQRSRLEQRIKELQEGHTVSTELQEKVVSLTSAIAAKDHEIEALMQALDEEEVQMEALTNKIEELEKVVQQKNQELENLEASRGKVVKKLSITVSKFDELHHFSESLLAEVEKLQSQLQDRDAEISFLRQEVTRCTNDVLVASQRSNSRDSDEVREFLTWFDTMISRVGLHHVRLDDKSSQVHELEILQKKVASIVSELEDLRVAAQSKDALLQVEKSRVEELTRREQNLEKLLHEKESQLNMLEGDDSGQATSTSEILEVEPVINKWAAPGTATVSQVRSLRKANNDHVAIAIDTDPSSNSRLEDEDEDKVHGFKSLTTSRVVPRFTRPVTDMIDGLWVSCDRALMRQPALRLGIMIYWAVLHALLAAFVV